MCCNQDNSTNSGTYVGPDIPSLGISNGDSFSEIINIITDYITSPTDGTNGTSGADGVGIASITELNGVVTFNLSDGSSFSTPDLTGPQGTPGTNGSVGAVGAQGPIGPAGTNGVGIQSTVENPDGSITWTYTDNSTFTSSVPTKFRFSFSVDNTGDPDPIVGYTPTFPTVFSEGDVFLDRVTGDLFQRGASSWINMKNIYIIDDKTAVYGFKASFFGGQSYPSTISNSFSGTPFIQALTGDFDNANTLKEYLFQGTSIPGLTSHQPTFTYPDQIIKGSMVFQNNSIQDVNTTQIYLFKNNSIVGDISTTPITIAAGTTETLNFESAVIDSKLGDNYHIGFTMDTAGANISANSIILVSGVFENEVLD